MESSGDANPADESKNRSDADIQLTEIGDLFEENAQLRSRNRKIALLGVVVIFVILTLFTVRLIGIFMDYQKYFDGIDQDAWQEALKNKNVPISTYQVGRGPEIEAAVREVIRRGEGTIPPAFKRVQKKVSEEILPDFSERVLKRLGKREDEFSRLSEQMLNNLKTHAETQVKSELMRVMVESTDGVSEDIRKVFPELDDRRLADEMNDSQEYFYSRLHELGMTKIAKFDPVIRGLRGQVDGLTKGKKVPPEMREQIANEFLEGLFDRMKYEFIPGLGEELVTPPATGKKKGGDR